MIYPVSNEVRNRIKRRQRAHEWERGGWDNCEPPPVAEILPFDQRRNRPTQRHQSACARPAAKLSGRGLLVSFETHSSFLLSDEPLLDFDALRANEHGENLCPVTDPERVR